ncbi:putative phospholipid-binding lipoprotein MlaA precursor [Marinomonas spartinae]|uniref:Putative phospholipid-binding lipoprotein MlaA n=1 Tax=Marinomonas spartinae TaxID=1792290 RepID=A0A1A8TIH7_9GAMM|nr:VacJ family lipoprotein [Marinomonas spartinae]SBS33490.1 putative phospholipid-binding lipoprotein MlaA precursor [Marinomonas spartinae]SBS34443.1 putative phospholipid-binding lipoprotein MlaA precursor [Marinomonas spartinae]
MTNSLLQRVGGVLLACLLVFSQAAFAAATDESKQDPWESWNRKVFNFNTTLDTHFFKPVARGYVDYTPVVVQRGVSNFFSNLGEVSNITNNALQGKKNGFVASTWRFVINSTIGIFGLFDVASALGLRQYDEDFGQTLGYWGVPSGPYLVLPFFGPSTVRDASGMVVDYSDYRPQDEVGLNRDQRWGLLGLQAINKRASLLGAENLIVGDPYTFVRDVYFQSRDHQVYDGNPPKNSKPQATDSWGEDSSTDSWGDSSSSEPQATDSWGDPIPAKPQATDSWGDPVPAKPQATDSWGDPVPAKSAAAETTSNQPVEPKVKVDKQSTSPTKTDSTQKTIPQNTDSSKNTQK